MKNSIKFVSLFVLAALVLAACTSPAAPTEAPAMPPSTTEAPMATEPMSTMPTEDPTMETQAPSPESTLPPSSDDSPDGMEVEIEDFAYIADMLTIKVGTTVTWTNKDAARHTVSSDTGIFESGLFGKGESFSYTFTEVGVFPYHCAPHPYMKGTITVTQ